MTNLNIFSPVQEQLRQVEDLMRAQAEGLHPDLGAALNHLLSAGGKRIRPVVSLLFGGMLKADPDKMILMASAIEMLHTATLVHDDLIDGALLRRGNPTINAQWSPAATVLTGDLIFSKAAYLAAKTDSIPVMKMFASTLSTIVNGEITQLFISRGLASRDDYYQRIYAKTASLFETAAGSAAILAPVDEETRTRSCRYGYQVGMAFQIVDDILDFTSEQETMGKPVASDLRQGLVTLPALIFLEMEPQDTDMQAVLNSNHRSEEVFKRVIAKIRESGAIQKSFEEASRFVETGLESLSGLPASQERDALEELAGYIVSRNI